MIFHLWCLLSCIVFCRHYRFLISKLVKPSKIEATIVAGNFNLEESNKILIARHTKKRHFSNSQHGIHPTERLFTCWSKTQTIGTATSKHENVEKHCPIKERHSNTPHQPPQLLASLSIFDSFYQTTEETTENRS